LRTPSIKFDVSSFTFVELYYSNHGKSVNLFEKKKVETYCVQSSPRYMGGKNTFTPRASAS
jgi:hypothetical protein